MVGIHQERTYRQLVNGHMSPIRVSVQETDLGVYAENLDTRVVREAIIEQRGYIEGYIRRNPNFLHALEPLPDDPTAPRIIQNMLIAGQSAKVGPMAAVAGAVAETVGRTCLNHVDELIIENGGDVFLSTSHALTVGIYAGKSPLSLNVGLKISPSEHPLAICTSSGTIGHSLSYGKADAVCVTSRSGALADAAATAIGNHVNSPDDIETAIRWGQTIAGVKGILIIVDDKMGAWGEITLTSQAASG